MKRREHIMWVILYTIIMVLGTYLYVLAKSKNNEAIANYGIVLTFCCIFIIFKNIIQLIIKENKDN